MQINSLQSAGPVQPPLRSTGAKQSGPIQSPAPVNPSLDQLDLSAEAQQLLSSQTVSSGFDGEIRTDRVASIRQAIAEGTYETPEKLSAALDRMLDAFT